MPLLFARTVPRGPFVVSKTPISVIVHTAGVRVLIETIVVLPVMRPAVVMLDAYK